MDKAWSPMLLYRSPWTTGQGDACHTERLVILVRRAAEQWVAEQE